MNIVHGGITNETIHKFGLTELLNIYKNNKKIFPKEYNPLHGYSTTHWIWGGDGYYADKDSDNWIYVITGFVRYLLYFEGVIYDIEIISDKQGNPYEGGDYSRYFELKDIKVLKSIDKWEKIPVKQINKYWASFRLKGDDFWAGEIPYEERPIDKNRLEDVKQYFKEALYNMEMNLLNGIVERTRKRRGSLDFSLNITIEMKW